MTTTEQLQAIRARCVELLAIAEKRTPGKWDATGKSIFKKHWLIISASCHEYVAEDCPIVPTDEQEANAARIVACVNALEGYNPAAVRDVVEALRSIYDSLSADTFTGDVLDGFYEQSRKALAALEGGDV